MSIIEGEEGLGTRCLLFLSSSIIDREYCRGRGRPGYEATPILSQHNEGVCKCMDLSYGSGWLRESLVHVE